MIVFDFKFDRSVLRCLTMGFLFSSLLTYAQEEVADGAEGEATEKPMPAIYLPLKPAFVANYGGAGRLRYIKVEISVRLANIDAANSVRYHSPFVRNNLLMLFASQTNATVGSQEGKEKIRADALEEVRNIVEREDKIPRDDVVDLYFNNFIVQR